MNDEIKAVSNIVCRGGGEDSIGTPQYESCTVETKDERITQEDRVETVEIDKVDEVTISGNGDHHVKSTPQHLEMNTRSLERYDMTIQKSKEGRTLHIKDGEQE